MGLPQYAITADDMPLTPANLSPESVAAFHRYCADSELGLLEEVMRDDPEPSTRGRIAHSEDNAFRRQMFGSGNTERDIFESVFDDQAPAPRAFAGKRSHTD